MRRRPKDKNDSSPTTTIFSDRNIYRRRQFCENIKKPSKELISLPKISTGTGGPHAPPEGRQHKELQTDRWMEEIRDKMEEKDVAVQTDEFERYAYQG